MICAQCTVSLVGRVKISSIVVTTDDDEQTRLNFCCERCRQEGIDLLIANGVIYDYRYTNEDPFDGAI